jgi:hypothetical protein
MHDPLVALAVVACIALSQSESVKEPTSIEPVSAGSLLRI